MATTTTRAQPSPWWVGVVCGMASYIDAATIVSFGIAATIYQSTLGLSALEFGLLQGLLTLGIALGALVSGPLGDRYGRRPVFSATMVLIIVGAALLTFSTAFPLLLVGTLLAGFGTGADLPVSLSTISEAADADNRGKLIGFSQILWFVGIAAAIVLATVVGGLGRSGAQILYAHVGAVSLLVLLLRLSIPESRRWQAARAERESGLPTVRAENAGVGALFTRAYVVPFAGLVAFYSLINLAGNTNGQFGATLLVDFGGLPIEEASAATGIALPVGLLSAILFLTVADGRRRFQFFVVGAVLTVLAPLIIVVFGFSVPAFLAQLVMSVVGAGFAGEAILKFWTQESFPTLIRTTAQGAIIFIARLLAAALALLTPTLLGAGPRPLYVALTLSSLIGVTVAWRVFRHRDAHDEFAVEAALDTDAAPPQRADA